MKENHADVWDAVLRLVEAQVPPHQFSNWIKPLKFIQASSAADGVTRIQLCAENDFIKDWIADHFAAALEGSASQVLGTSCRLEIQVLQSPNVETAPEPTSGVVIRAGAVQPRESNTFGIDRRYTFDNFVVGASNQFAHAAAVAVAEQPGQQYNPLFIYSPPGLGKTHLLNAIGALVTERNPSARVAYLSAESFVNEYIDSVLKKTMPQFRTKYRDSYQFILVDDVQAIVGKEKSEEEFFHTFNALHQSKRQIVMTSDRPPKEIKGLEERIRTRFEWGLVVDVRPPEIETRIAILKAKAERDDIYLPDNVATFIATYVKNNIRELEGTLVKIEAQASLTGAEITLDLAKAQLQSYLPSDGAQTYTAEAIQTAVLKKFGIKPQDLRSESRARHLAIPRQIAMYLTRKYTQLGYKEIGTFFERDHTTVMHACSQIEKKIETDPELHSSVEAVQNLL